MSTTPDFTLVSFKICPFVQRSRIILNYKAVPYEITYIDLANKPEWFLTRVPTGKVPALFIGEETLFESTVINEFLDEVTPGRLLSENPLARARQRAWISFTESAIMQQYRMMIANNKTDYQEQQQQLLETLRKLTDTAVERLDSAEAMTLLDAAIAPVFKRIHEVSAVKHSISDALGEHHPVMQWGDRLLALPAVEQSVPEDFSEQFIKYFKNMGSFIL